MAKYLFGGFERACIPCRNSSPIPNASWRSSPIAKSQKWFKPAKGQFQIFYKFGGDHPNTSLISWPRPTSLIYMLEPKAKNEMEDADVLAKKAAAVKWCKQATDYAPTYGGKPWQYVLIPHDVIADNMTLLGLAQRYGVNE